MENFEKKLKQPLEKKIEEEKSPEVNFDELKRIREKVNESISVKERLKIHDEMVKFARKLQEKYPDYQNYKIYHFLIGSSLPEKGDFKDGDFPGEYSIANFINSFDKK